MQVKNKWRVGIDFSWSILKAFNEKKNQNKLITNQMEKAKQDITKVKAH